MNTLFWMLEQGGLLKSVFLNQEAPKAIISASVYLPQEQGASQRCSQTVLVYGAQDHDTNMSVQLGKASVALTNAISCWSSLFVPFNISSRSMKELRSLPYLAKTSSDFKTLAPVRLVNRQIIWHSDSPLNCVLNTHPHWHMLHEV